MLAPISDFTSLKTKVDNLDIVKLERLFLVI